MILAFDTETTGLPDWGQPSESPQQPHLVQLAMILLDDDLTERACIDLIIKPDGWEIPAEVTEIHGIDTALASRVGVSEKTATELFAQLLYNTKARALAHNVSFDLRIMRIALLRAGYPKEWLDLNAPASYCTMKVATPILNLPPTTKMVRAGFNKPKQPKLSECVEHFFGEKLEGAHNALVDVRGCVRVFRHLIDMERRPVEPIGDVV